jgi:hypothetical protein
MEALHRLGTPRQREATRSPEDRGKFSVHRHSVFGDAEKTTFAPMDFWRGYAARAGQLRSQGLQAMIRLHPEEGIRVHEEGAVVAWLRCINPVISTGFE